MPRLTGEDDMRLSLRNPFQAWQTRLFRRCRLGNSSILLVFVSAFVCLFMFDAGRILTTAMLSDGNRAGSEGDRDPLVLASLTHKMKSIADNKRIRHVDLSIAINDVKFRENRRKLLCFEWDSVRDKIVNQVRSEQDEQPEGESRPSNNLSDDESNNEILPKWPRLLGKTGNHLRFPHQSKDESLNSKNSTNKSVEPGLLAPVSPSAAILKALYRRAISHAVEVINKVVNGEPITSCTFPGFSQEESELIWAQASRGVRIQHTCKRYTAFLYPTDADQDVLWAPKDNLGYCHQMEVGPNTWMKFFLERGGDEVDSVATSDEVESAARLRQLYPPLQGWRMTELQTQKPLLFTVVGHPFDRIVSTYVNHIQRHYRYELSPDWIKELRGKTFQEIVNGIRKNLVAKNPALARRGGLNQLLAPTEGFGVHNKIRRQSNSTDTRLNFREFVWLVIKQNLECFNDIDCLSQVDPHWRPQYIWCSPCSLNFDLIIKGESFQRDSNLLLKLLGKPMLPDASVEATNNSSTDHVTESSQSDGIRSTSSIKSNSNSDINSTSSPVVEEKKQESSLNVTSNDNGSNSTKVDPFELDPSQIDEGLPLRTLAYDYLAYLTDEEIKLIYITYSYDFTLFGYNTVDF